MKRILFTGNTLSGDRIRELYKQGYEIVPTSYDLSESEIAELLTDCDGYILGGDEVVTEKMLQESGDRLKAISFFGAGYEKYIDVEATKRRHIAVSNTPGANSNSVAEFTIALMLSATKDIVNNVINTKKGIWDRPKTFDVAEKTIGIIGMGNVGKRVAQILSRGFDANVIYYSRTRKLDIEKMCRIKYVSLNELIERADIISIHSSLTEETKNMIDADSFIKMKNGVVIVNTARVEIINESALLNALKEGKVSKCAFDGFYKEPINEEIVSEHEILRMDNKQFIVTPHMAYYTSDAIRKMEEMALNNVIKMIDTGTCDCLVN